jgi:uroporphyrinogen-III synthase
VRVIVTRPQQDAGPWVTALAEAGHDAVALPLLGVGPPPDPAAVVAAWGRMAAFDAVMFVSGNAVAQFFALKPAAASAFTAQAAIKTRAFVVGPGSVAALLRAGAEPAYIDAPSPQAGQFDSEALWAVVGPRVRPGYRVLLVRGADSAHAAGAGVGNGAGRDWFANQVLAAGGSVEYVVAYQRRAPALRDSERALAHQAAQDGSVWLFSSSEAIGNLVAACGSQSWQQARAVATHPRIAQAARAAGFAVVCESRPTLAAVLASIESLQ